MAITNAQQYQQLVNKPAGNKRPGYRGEGEYQGGRGIGGSKSSSSKSSSSKSSSSGGSSGGGDRQLTGDDYRRAKRDFEIGVAGGLAKDVVVGPDGPYQPGTYQSFKDKRPRVNIPNFGLSGMFLNLFNKGVNSPIQKFADFTASKNRPYFVDEVIRAGKIPGLNFGTVSEMTEDELEAAYKSYLSDRLNNKTDAYGNPNPGFDSGGDGDGMSDYERRLLALEQSMSPTTEPEVDPDSLEGMLANRVAYRFMADGGMTNDAPVEGGIMDLESGRQMYFLGKLVKKATRAVKKIAKSPIGKAALLYAGGSFLGGGGGGLTSIFGKDAFLRKTLLPKLYKDGAMTGLGKIALGGALTAAPLLFQEEEEEPDYANNRGPGLDINAIRSNPYNTMGSSYRFFAEGGDVEPVAKETMPLIDMDGKEMDLRADGGFVPIGRMERADDVPARLSKNEFVFTADAVRNAGEGDIDKGAEVMYNMMKNLESGGEVSEESQGLDGARDMFQTSKRLEEVL